MPRKPRYQLIDGLRMPLGFPADALRSALEYRPGAGDVVVGTYPKCGTTWVQYIVYLLCARGRPLGPGAKLADAFPHIEEVGRAAVEALPAPRLIKTHLPATLFPVVPEARYVYVVRNPFDCVVSFYHHTRGFPRHYDFADGEFAAFFECFVRGEVDFGDYFDHLASWHAHVEDANVLRVTFESLKTDAAARIVEIGRFLGGAAAASAADPAVVAAVAAESGFASMSRDQQRWSSARPADEPFVRAGRVGDWRDYLSPSQAARLLERFEHSTRGTPAAALWPDHVAAARALAP